MQRQQMAALARAGQENAILTGFRKQMETIEDKLSADIVRSQQKGDMLREAALARYDCKLLVLEANQPRVDRRLAEVTGGVRAVSDELQNQTRRIDQADSRLYEWRHQLEEEIRAKLTELEQNYQNVASALRVHRTSSDDVCKKYNQRLLRLEGMMEEHSASTEDTTQSILQLHTRLAGVEDAAAERARATAIALSPHPNSSILECDLREKTSGSVSLASMEKQVAELQQQMEGMQTQSQDLLTLVESQGERYKSLRTLGETKEEQYRALAEGLGRGSVDDRLKDIQASIRDSEEARAATSEQMELLQRRLDEANGANEELSNTIRRMQERRGAEGLVGGVPPPWDSGLAAAGFGLEVAPPPPGDFAEHAERLSEVETQVGTLGVKLEALREDQELGSRLAALVGALKDISPKVLSHDVLLQQLQQDLGEATDLGTQRHKDVVRTMSDLQQHVDHVTREVGRLSAEIDGPDVGEAEAEAEAGALPEQPLDEKEVAQPATASGPQRRRRRR